MSDLSKDPFSSVEQELWLQLRSNESNSARNRLLELYDRLAKSIAAGLYKVRIDNSVSFDDYLQYARAGLIDAIGRFDCDRGVAFATYASVRIRGSVLNGITKESEAAAQRAAKLRRTEERVTSLRNEISPTIENLTLDGLSAIAMGLAVGSVIEEYGERHDTTETIDPSPANNPYLANEVRQLSERIRFFMHKLPAQEFTVMHGHYVDMQDFKSLSEKLGVTKGRVSQIHGRAILRLREWLCDAGQLDKRL